MFIIRCIKNYYSICFIILLYEKKKCGKWTDQHDTSVGQRKDLSPCQELNPWPPEQRVGALSNELWELMESKVI